jgi:endonuclease YncB( thermonuclease family)
MRKNLLAIAVTLLATGPALADVTGRASVLGGDVLSINDQQFRLFGIDSVELNQFCYVDGKLWACGPVAIRTLEVQVALEPVTCSETGEPASELGVWAVCTVGGRDLSETLVRMGMAVANRDQSTDYVAAEEAAKAEGVGIWQGNFIAPWVFRADMRAIEERVAERLRDTLRTRIEDALFEGSGSIQVLQGFEITRADGETVPREYAADELAPGYLTQLDPEAAPFSWRDSAAEIVAWRDSIVEYARISAVQAVWSELAARPRLDVTVDDAEEYLRAVEEQAAPWIEAGRQPILLVRSQGDPPWISEWLGGEYTAAIAVTKKSGLDSSLYFGTVNGIDIYRGSGPAEGESFLFPDDVLTTVTYGTGADGRVVSVETEKNLEREGNKLIFHYSQGLDWKDDVVVVLHYPFEPVIDYEE